MYKQFTCNNDNVYIADDKGNLTIREYSNNIKDILDKENEIKVLEVELDKESKLKKQAEKSIKSKKVLVKYLLASIGIPVVFYVVTGVGSKLLLSPEQFESLLVYTPRFPEGINEFSIFSLEIGMFTISLGIIGTVVETINNHLSKKEIEFKSSEISIIKDIIDVKKEELKKLHEKSNKEVIYNSNQVVSTNANYINADNLRILKK